jgi:hypothetical protein
MTTMTSTQADRIHARTAQIVARMRADADAAEKAGNLSGAQALRDIADSRERAGMRARAGAHIGQA